MSLLRKLAEDIVRRGHEEHEDCWYSCPKHEDCCHEDYSYKPIEDRPCYCYYDQAVEALKADS